MVNSILTADALRRILQHTDGDAVTTIDEHKVYYNGVHDILFCEPRMSPADLKKFYADQHYLTDYQHAKGIQSYRDRFVHDTAVGMSRLSRYRSLAHLDDDHSWCDLGSGSCGFLMAALINRYDAVAVDMTDCVHKTLPKELSDKCYSGDVAEDFTLDRRVDVVTLHDVIEHVSDPEPLLLGCLSRLLKKEGGYLVIDTPDISQAQSLKTFHHVKPKEHPVLYSSTALQHVVKDICINAGYSCRVTVCWTPIIGKTVSVFNCCRV